MSLSYLPTENWPAIDRLFRYALRGIAAESVDRFVLDGPWTEGTRNHWRELIESGRIRRRSLRHCDDVIGDMVSLSGDLEYRRFRVFTSTVGLLFVAHLGHCEIVHPLNYLVIRFLQDDAELGDRTLTAHIAEALEELYESLASDKRHNDVRCEEQAVFCLMGVILLKLRQGEPDHSLRDLAARLIAAEAAAPEWHRTDNRFLLGVTNFDQFHDDWKAEIMRTIPSDCQVEELVLIRDGVKLN